MTSHRVAPVAHRGSRAKPLRVGAHRRRILDGLLKDYGALGARDVVVLERDHLILGKATHYVPLGDLFRVGRARAEVVHVLMTLPVVRGDQDHVNVQRQPQIGYSPQLFVGQVNAGDER